MPLQFSSVQSLSAFSIPLSLLFIHFSYRFRVPPNTDSDCTKAKCRDSIWRPRYSIRVGGRPPCVVHACCFSSLPPSILARSPLSISCISCLPSDSSSPLPLPNFMPIPPSLSLPLSLLLSLPPCPSLPRSDSHKILISRTSSLSVVELSAAAVAGAPVWFDSHFLL